VKELYALSSYALSDLFEIWDHIRQNNPDAADRVETELLTKCESLARMPGQGHRRTDPLQILAIVHGARDVRKVLKQRDLET
jgi:plasmid stabilization system protein ParE